METKQLQFVLGELHFSADMPTKVLEQLAAAATLRQMSTGVVVFREGSTHDNIYLIRSGRIALEMKVPGRGAVRILTLGPGEMVGWSALLDHGKMTSSAVVVDDCEAVVAPAVTLKQISDANCDFGFHLMRQLAGALSKRLVATRLQLLDLFADSPSPVPARTEEGTK